MAHRVGHARKDQSYRRHRRSRARKRAPNIYILCDARSLKRITHRVVVYAKSARALATHRCAMRITHLLTVAVCCPSAGCVCVCWMRGASTYDRRATGARPYERDMQYNVDPASQPTRPLTRVMIMLSTSEHHFTRARACTYIHIHRLYVVSVGWSIGCSDDLCV